MKRITSKLDNVQYLAHICTACGQRRWTIIALRTLKKCFLHFFFIISDLGHINEHLCQVCSILDQKLNIRVLNAMLVQLLS